MAGTMPLSRAMLAAVNREIADRTTVGRKVTTADLSRATGIPDKTLHRRLDGETRMDPDTFEALCLALGVTVEDMWARARRIQATEPLGSDGTTVELLGALGAKYEREVAKVRRPPPASSERPTRKRRTS